MIKGKEKSRGHWKIGIMNHLYIGINSIIRVAQLRIGKELNGRPIQLLYSLELQCEVITTKNEDKKKYELNPAATEFRSKQLLLKSQIGGQKTLLLRKMMVTFDNTYQMEDMHVENIVRYAM